MKKLFAVVTAVMILNIGLSGISYARNEGWYAAGGLLGGLVLGAALSSRPYYYGSPYYYGGPGYYAAPVYYYPRPYYYSYPACPAYSTYSTTYTTSYPPYVDTYCY